MKASKTRPAGTQRVQRHRVRQERGGKSRVEVTVPATDARLVRTVADWLRAGGHNAAAIREALAPALASGRARTGEELLAFFRASPLVGVDLRVERDKSAGRKSLL
jgi:hypothetical protein